MASLHLLYADTGGQVAPLAAQVNLDQLEVTPRFGRPTMLSFRDQISFTTIPGVRKSDVARSLVGTHQLGRAKGEVQVVTFTDRPNALNLKIESPSKDDLVALRATIMEQLGFPTFVYERPKPSLREVSLVAAAANDVRRLGRWIWNGVGVIVNAGCNGPLFKIGW